jgi:hypothetical protein
MVAPALTGAHIMGTKIKKPGWILQGFAKDARKFRVEI